MLYFLIFIEGYIGLAFQMLFLRQLTPVVGSSAVTSSWIIGFFLLALAIGYKKGGIKQEKPIVALAKNLIKVALVGGVGASSFFILFYFQLLEGLPTLLLLASYSLIVVSPVAYWMGQSLPLLIQESKWGSNSSEVSGNALYLSTIGSFVGAILTTNVLLFFIGATFTLLLVSMLSVVIGFYYVRDNKFKVLSLMTVVALLSANLGFSYLLKMHSSAYADIYIMQENNTKYFVANNTVMSKLKNGKNDAWYLKQFNDFIQENKIKEKSLLILGAGGFVAHLEDNDNKYTYVDIDPALKEISEKEFIQQKVTHDFVAKDARQFLVESNDNYDVIFLDAFSSLRSIPSHLVTKEFFELTKSRLPLNGYLVVNVIIDPLYKSPYGQRFHSTLLSVYPFCDSVNNHKEGQTLANVIYVCQKKTNAVELYTDDTNQNELDYWRK